MGKRKTHCKHGHLRSLDNVMSNGSCRECNLARAKQWRLNNNGSDRQNHREWYAKNLEEQRKVKLARYHKNPEQAKNSKLKARYGLSLEDVEKMRENQGNKCLVCLKSFSEKITPRVDHCHVSNKIRGLLCHKCNSAIGYFEENIESLRRAIEYINKFQEAKLE